MTLGIGDRVAKLKSTWNPETKQREFSQEVVQGEMYREFEIVAVGTQGEEPFIAVLKKVQ